MYLAVVLVAAALLVLSWSLGRAAARFYPLFGEMSEALERMAEGPEVPFTQRLDLIEHQVELLPKRWEEFKNEARRAEDRARAVVRSAQKELEELGVEHPGVEGAARELQLVDDRGSRDEAVPPVRQNVEGAPAAPQDWRAAGLRRKFGA